jgi:hypothetical protein
MSEMLLKAIIEPAFRIAGILHSAGQVPNDSEQAEALRVVNDWLDWLKLDRLAVYAIHRTLVTLTPNKGDYTIGQDGHADITQERPVRIDRASFIFTNVTPNIEVPLDVLNEQEWQALSPKSLTASTPTKLYYEPAYPNGIINLWAIPSVAYQMALYLWESVNQYTAVTDPVAVAPGYRLAMQYNVAVQLAERYPERQHITGTAVARAVSSLAAIKRANAPTLLMQCESGALGLEARGKYNIYSNSYSSGVS